MECWVHHAACFEYLTKMMAGRDLHEASRVDEGIARVLRHLENNDHFGEGNITLWNYVLLEIQTNTFVHVRVYYVLK